jgi:O-antigen ligase
MLKDLSKFSIGYINSEKILLYTLSIFPLAFLIGNFVINFFIIIIPIFFFILTLKKKIKFNFQNKIFLIMLLFWFSLIVNLFFSQNQSLSIPRVIKIFFIIFLVSAFKYIVFLNENKYLNNIYKIWSIIFFVVFIDLIFEFMVGFNILGFKSYIPGRLASFTGNELVIGNFFSAFCLIFLSYISIKYPKKNNIIIFLSLVLIFVSFLIGERANFIRTFLMISLFFIFVVDYKYKTKLLFIFVIFSLIPLLITNLKDDNIYKSRYFISINNLFQKNGISAYLNNSQYGAHYDVAYKIFKENKLFGVGIKNFRKESFKSKYENPELKFKDMKGSTHPHQIHLEFLSETGLFGYSIFLIFIILSIFLSIKSNLKNKNVFQFSGILFVIFSLLPLIPTGSFFSTYSSGLFWINYSLMVGYIRD